jgi:arylformamidase
MDIVDLTREISQDSRVFPGSPRPSFIKWSKFDTHGYDSEVMFLSTHTGTRMDAPCHFTLDAKSIDQISVRRFISKDTVLLKIEKEANELITNILLIQGLASKKMIL